MQIFKLELTEEPDLKPTEQFFSSLERATDRITDLNENNYVFLEYKITLIEVE